MQPILHHTTKYDGSLHYRFPARVAHREDDVLVVYRGPGVELESYRGAMVSDRRMLIFFYAHRYHNVVISWDADWTPHMHYVNIASPAEWDEERVTAIDLDLDVVRPARDGVVYVDDEEEFETHIDLFSYPEALVSTCRSELSAVVKEMSDRTGLYSDEVFDWRPGAPFEAGYLRRE